MSLTKPQVRRLLRDQLQELVAWLEVGDDERPELFGSRDEYEWLLRLAALTLSLVTRHGVDEQGRCQRCTQPRRGWRRLLPHWTRRAHCKVLQAAAFLTESPVELVWWQAFGLRGDDISLDEVHAWLRPTESARTEPAAGDDHALLSDAHVQLRDAPRSLPQPYEELRPRPYANSAMPTERFRWLPVPAPDADTEKLPKIDKP